MLASLFSRRALLVSLTLGLAGCAARRSKVPDYAQFRIPMEMVVSPDTVNPTNLVYVPFYAGEGFDPCSYQYTAATTQPGVVYLTAWAYPGVRRFGCRANIAVFYAPGSRADRDRAELLRSDRSRRELWKWRLVVCQPDGTPVERSFVLRMLKPDSSTTISSDSARMMDLRQCAPQPIVDLRLRMENIVVTDTVSPGDSVNIAFSLGRRDKCGFHATTYIINADRIWLASWRSSQPGGPCRPTEVGFRVPSWIGADTTGLPKGSFSYRWWPFRVIACQPDGGFVEKHVIIRYVEVDREPYPLVEQGESNERVCRSLFRMPQQTEKSSR